MTWARWQRICGWAALAAGAAWGVKFVVLLVSAGWPGAAEVLTGFVLPTLGSILGLVAALGIAVPLVRRHPRALAFPLVVGVGLVAVLLFSLAANAVLELGVVDRSQNIVIREEASTLVSSALYLLVAAWLLVVARPDAE
jgi:hypothetical protein